MKIKYICSICGAELVENGYVDRERWWLESPAFPHKTDKDRGKCRKKWENTRLPGSRYDYDIIRKEIQEKSKEPIRSRHLVRYG